MKEQIERLRGAVKAAAITARRWKHGPGDGTFVRDPSFRATVLCTAIAHSRGRIHATKMHGADHVAPDYPTNYRVIDTLDKQELLLGEWLQSIERYSQWALVIEGRWRKAELDEDERAIVRTLLDTTPKWLEEKEAARAAA